MVDDGERAAAFWHLGGPRVSRCYGGVVKIVCPTCNKQLENVPGDYPHRPFCSARCKAIDLGNWLDGVYRFSRPLVAEDLEDDEFGA